MDTGCKKEFNFIDDLFGYLNSNRYNEVTNNFDYYRFGAEENLDFKSGFKNKIKLLLSKDFEHLHFQNQILNKIIEYSKYYGNLNFLYNLLENDASKKLLLEIISYRILGYRIFKLSNNTDKYWENLNKLKSLQESNEFINVKFNSLQLYKYNLQKIGYDIQVFFTIPGINTDFILEQYAYKVDDFRIGVEPGDYVIDGGGCWGDTALYFSDKIGNNGRVFVFEFIPSNLDVLRKNLSLNPNHSKQIEIISKPLWNKSDVEMYYLDNGPGSFVSLNSFEEAKERVSTTTIDAEVEARMIEKVDFIKMDIEGAEPMALIGAIKTIKKFKPKLAIAIYHSLEDFYTIPKMIDELNLGYKFYLGHYTIHSEETVLFATVN